MSRNTIITLCCALAFAWAGGASAQSGPKARTLFNDSTMSHGGYFSLTGKYTSLLGSDALLLGGGALWSINGRLGIGLAGYGLSSFVSNPQFAEHLAEQGEQDLRGLSMRYGYGGLLLEPVLFSRSVVHVALPILLGAGGMHYGYPRNSTNTMNEYRPLKVDGTAFFAAEPGIEVGISLIEPLRIGFGMSYLYTSDLKLPGTPADMLHTPFYRVSIKVGQF